jgi:hypothetical protein
VVVEENQKKMFFRLLVCMVLVQGVICLDGGWCLEKQLDDGSTLSVEWSITKPNIHFSIHYKTEKDINGYVALGLSKPTPSTVLGGVSDFWLAYPVCSYT